MTASLNRVYLAGRLTRDPQVRYTPSGSAVADLGIAVDDSYRSKTGETVERTCFVDVTVWGRQAETSGEYLSKGSSVLIEGSLEFDQWENQQGEKRNKVKVRAARVQFLDPPPRGEYKDASASSDTGGTSAGSAAPPKPEAIEDNEQTDTDEDPF
ncbi:MAG: single-stranded DNA-binding protein [Spartobacteria bacterium]|nr:single-stranded DNA-binding protein [Spartobacteria bacterium]